MSLSRRASVNASLRIAIPNDSVEIVPEFCSQKDTLVLKPRERRVSCFTRLLEPAFYEPFSFLYVTSPAYGWMHDQGIEFLKRLEMKISKMEPMPKFLALCGGFTSSESMLTDTKPLSVERINSIFHNTAIKIVCVASRDDLNTIREKHNVDWRETLNIYRSWFGDDWFGFWVSGVSFLVVNSTFQDEILAKRLYEEQRDWLEGELLQNVISEPKQTIVLQETHRGRQDDENGTSFTSMFQEHDNFDDTFHVFCSDVTGNVENIHVTTVPKVSPTSQKVRLAQVSENEVTSDLYSIEDLPEEL